MQRVFNYEHQKCIMIELYIYMYDVTIALYNNNTVYSFMYTIALPGFS